MTYYVIIYYIVFRKTIQSEHEPLKRRTMKENWREVRIRKSKGKKSEWERRGLEINRAYHLKLICVEKLFIVYFKYRLEEETTALKTKREKLMMLMEKHVIFQRYLDKVIENAEEFHEIREVIARHDTLTATHDVNEK